MKLGVSTILGVGACLVLALAVASGCAGKSISGGDSAANDKGSGGSSGTGPVGTTGGTGTAGTAVVTGGSAGSAGTSGVGGAGPGCGPADGPRSTPEAVPTIPFSLNLGGTGGAGGEAAVVANSGAGGGDDEPPSGCTPIDYGHRCRGTTRARKSDSELEFYFDDGSSLAWMGVARTHVAPPSVDDGETSFIEYTHEEPPLYSGTSNLTARTSLSIAHYEGAPPLWMGREGSTIDEISPILVEGLLGVTVRREYVCTADRFYADCFQVERDLWTYVVEAEPEQPISNRTATRVSTPRGEFDVIWASSEQREEPFGEFCYDLPAKDRGFALSLVGPPLP